MTARSPPPRASAPPPWRPSPNWPTPGGPRSSRISAARCPPGLVEMLSISGLGVAKIRQIHETLGIDSLPELEAAATDGRLAGLPRFGQKTADNIRKSIAFLRQASAFRLAHHAADEARTLVEALQRVPGVLRAVAAGEVRRRSEVVRELVIVLVAEVPAAEVFARLSQVPGVHEFAGQDERHVTLRFVGGTSAQVVVTPPLNAGAVLVQATGSDAHLRQLEAARGRRGLLPPRRGALARQRVRPHARRGRALPGARPRRDSAGIARGRRRSARPPRRARCRSSSRSPTCAASCIATRTTPTARTPWRTSPRGVRAAGYDVGRHHRPQPVGRLRRRALPGRRSAGRPRTSPTVRAPDARLPHPARRRGRHPGGRAPRLRRRRPGTARFRHRLHPQPVQPERRRR